MRNVTTQEWLDIDSYYMYGDTQNTGATRSQRSLDISTFRVSYKAMTHQNLLFKKLKYLCKVCFLLRGIKNAS